MPIESRLDASWNGCSADAVHAAVMLNNDVREIATFDAGFDRIPGVRRAELV